MNPARTTCLLMLLLGVCAFILATTLIPRRQLADRLPESGGGLLATWLGEGRQVLSRYLFTQADVYFHRGYYPDSPEEWEEYRDVHPPEEHDDHAHDDHAHDDPHNHEREQAHEHEPIAAPTPGRPRDWIQRFSRQFGPRHHVHLGQDKAGLESEILPWLRFAAWADPRRVENFTVGAYWLREQLNQPHQAEQFLREGLRANPNNCELLYELGVVYAKHLDQPDRARNVWELALRRWEIQEAGKPEPDTRQLAQIISNLARLEEKAGNLRKAIEHMRRWQAVAVHPEAVDHQIEELEEQLSNQNPDAKAGSQPEAAEN